MPLRVAFFGTPEFSIPSLQTLIADDRFEVVAVVTQPDKPVGRKQVLTASPIKQLALEHNIPVHQPKTLSQKKDEGVAFASVLRELNLDLCVVIAYGKIVPQTILDIPTYGCINIHGSILPLLRGASPIQYTILEGHEEAGVTIMQMDAGMDTGDMLHIERIPVAAGETSSTLHDKLKVLGAEVLGDVLIGYVTGEIAPLKQDDESATYCSLIKKEDGLIDWSRSADEIDRQIRAYTPWPGCYTIANEGSENELRVKILEAHVEEADDERKLVIKTVQPAGKKPMSYQDFQRGNPEVRFQQKRRD